MKVLIIHNYYQIRGGEDAVFENETALLVDNGWEVSRFSVHNDSITGALGKLKAALSIVFSFPKYFELKKLLRDIQPDVVHVHNYFPLISPAVFYACASLGVPVVHSLHNYRAICPTATLMHEGQLCDRSVKAGSWWCVAKKVYRNSYLGSFFVCAMVEIHKRIGTWQEKVDCFIALTDTARRKYVDAGWPACKMVVKPNFLIDSSIASVPDAQKEHYAIFVGRLSQEKGLEVLIRAWQEIGLPLLVVGEGDAPVVHDSNPNIRYLGRKVKGETLELIHQADF